MQPISNIPYSQGCIGPADIDPKIVEDAISYLKRGVSQIQNDIQAPHKIIKSFVPTYLSQKKIDKENRFYIDLEYTIANLNPTLPTENLLTKLFQKVAHLGIVGKRIDMRFEKGCIGASSNFWHKDFREKFDINILSLSYSNFQDWSTKILEDSSGYIEFMSGGACIHNNTYSKKLFEKCEEISESSKIGVIYNVNEVWHRSPMLADFPNHVQENDYRLFIKFNDRG